jgi:hypothetical protein
MVENPSDGAPVLLLDPPLTSAASTRLGYQETATFYSTSQEQLTVTFQRPGFVAAGNVMTEPSELSGPLTLLRAGSPLGLEIQIVSDGDLDGAQALLAVVKDSLAEG